MRQQLPPTVRMIRLPEVKRRVGLARSTIYRLMGSGGFPKSHKLGPRAIAWLEADIDGWIDTKSSDRIG